MNPSYFFCFKRDFNYCPKLQRLFLSYNEIKSFSCLKTLETIANLQELCLDNNPICNLEANVYKRNLLVQIPTLRKLDTKRITDEEKRVAEKSYLKEINKKREQDNMAMIEEKKKLAIKDAENEWLSTQDTSGIEQNQKHEKIKIVSLSSGGSNQTPPTNNYPNTIISSSSSSSLLSNDRDLLGINSNLDDTSQESNYVTLKQTDISSSNNKSSQNSRSNSATRVAATLKPLESSPKSTNVTSNTNTVVTTPVKKSTSLNGGTNILEENVMSFFGSKSLDILESKLDVSIINQVQIISFNYIEYDDFLVKFFAKIKTKFPNVNVSKYF